MLYTVQFLCKRTSIVAVGSTAVSLILFCAVLISNRYLPLRLKQKCWSIFLISFYHSAQHEDHVTKTFFRQDVSVWDSGNNQDLMRREFRAQNVSLFSHSAKSLLISTICRFYVYTLIRSW